MPSPNPIDLCCAIGKQFDIPEVQTVVIALTSIGGDIVDSMINEVAREVAQAQRDEPSPEWILLVMALFDRALFSAPTEAQRGLVRDAVLRIGAREKAKVAVENFFSLLRGRFQRRRDDLRSIFSRRDGNEQTLRAGIRQVIGKHSDWIRHAADLWSYRWHWVSEVLRGRTRGVKAFRYWNPDDERTTPFCRWLVRSGRTVTVATVLRQVNELERAVVENDFEKAAKAWPILQFNGNETDKDFNELFVNNGLGAPPFHFFCRTRLLPVS